MKDMKTNWGQNRTERPTTALHRLIIMIMCLCAMQGRRIKIIRIKLQYFKL